MLTTYILHQCDYTHMTYHFTAFIYSPSKVLLHPFEIFYDFNLFKTKHKMKKLFAKTFLTMFCALSTTADTEPKTKKPKEKITPEFNPDTESIKTISWSVIGKHYPSSSIMNLSLLPLKALVANVVLFNDLCDRVLYTFSVSRIVDSLSIETMKGINKKTAVMTNKEELKKAATQKLAFVNIATERQSKLSKSLIDRLDNVLFMVRESTLLDPAATASEVNYLKTLFAKQRQFLYSLSNDTNQHTTDYLAKWTNKVGTPQIITGKHYRHAILVEPLYNEGHRDPLYQPILAAQSPAFKKPWNVDPCNIDPKSEDRKITAFSTTCIPDRKKRSPMPYSAYIPLSRPKRFLFVLLGLAISALVLGVTASLSLSIYDTAMISTLKSVDQAHQQALEDICLQQDVASKDLELLNNKIDTLSTSFSVIVSEIAFDKTEVQWNMASNILFEGMHLLENEISKYERAMPELRNQRFPLSLTSANELQNLYDNSKLVAAQNHQRLYYPDPSGLLLSRTLLFTLDGNPFIMSVIPTVADKLGSYKVLKFTGQHVSYGNMTYSFKFQHEHPYLLVNDLQSEFKTMSQSEYDSCTTFQTAQGPALYCPQLSPVYDRNVQASCQMRLLRSNFLDLDQYCDVEMTHRSNYIHRVNITHYEIFSEDSNVARIRCSDSSDESQQFKGVMMIRIPPNCYLTVQNIAKVYGEQIVQSHSALRYVYVSLQAELFLATFKIGDTLKFPQIEQAFKHLRDLGNIKKVDMSHVKSVLTRSATLLASMNSTWADYKTEIVLGLGFLIFILTGIAYLGLRWYNRNRRVRHNLDDADENALMAPPQLMAPPPRAVALQPLTFRP